MRPSITGRAVRRSRNTEAPPVEHAAPDETSLRFETPPDLRPLRCHSRTSIPSLLPLQDAAALAELIAPAEFYCTRRVIAPAALIAPAAPIAPAEPLAPSTALPPRREPCKFRPFEMARVSASSRLTAQQRRRGSVSRVHAEQQLGSIEFNLGELSRTVTRLKEQLRKLEIRLRRRSCTGTKRMSRIGRISIRWNSIAIRQSQQSRAPWRIASDVGSIQGLLENLISEAQNLLQQQSRTVTELQKGSCVRALVSMQRHVPRLARIVRQSAAKPASRGAGCRRRLGRTRSTGALSACWRHSEHMLRNAVVHGIESRTCAARGQG